jgi:hypothetical protein
MTDTATLIHQLGLLAACLTCKPHLRKATSP